MTSILTGDDILQNNGVIPAAPSVDGILRTVVLPTAEKIDFSNYLGVWQGDGLDFDPSIKKTYKFLGDEGSKLTVENGPSKIGGLTSQAFKISFTSGDRSTIFTGNANLSDARFEPYPSEPPPSWRANGSFSYKMTGESSTKDDDITASASFQNSGTSTMKQSESGGFSGSISNLTNSKHSLIAGGISVSSDTIFSAINTASNNTSTFSSKLTFNSFKFDDNTTPEDRFTLSYKGYRNKTHSDRLRR